MAAHGRPADPGRNGHEPDALTPPEPMLEHGPGPDAVRVTLAPASAHGPSGSMVVDPGRAGDPPLVDGETRLVSLRRLDADRARLDADGATPRSIVLLEPEPAVGAPAGTVRREVLVDGWRVVVDLEPERRARLRERATRGRGAGARRGPLEVRAIIPGRVLAITVAVGEAVAAGHQVMTIEAMKMQNELRVPRDGTVTRIAVAPGQTIEVGDLLLVIE